MKKRYIQLLVGVVLVVLTPIAIITLQNSQKAQAAWLASLKRERSGFDDFWGYRQAVTITVTSGRMEIV